MTTGTLVALGGAKTLRKRQSSLPRIVVSKSIGLAGLRISAEQFFSESLDYAVLTSAPEETAGISARRRRLGSRTRGSPLELPGAAIAWGERRSEFWPGQKCSCDGMCSNGWVTPCTH